MKSNNKRKCANAIVWYNGELKMILNNSVGKDYVLLNDLDHTVKKRLVKLAKIGDSVKYKDLSILPKRCADKKNMKITYIRSNGIIGTDKDLYPKSDGSSYGHFVADKKQPFKCGLENPLGWPT